jgi:hypothetical protein
VVQGVRSDESSPYGRSLVSLVDERRDILETERSNSVLRITNETDLGDNESVKAAKQQLLASKGSGGCGRTTEAGNLSS